VRVGVDLRYGFIMTVWIWLKLYAHHHTTIPGDINDLHVAGNFGQLYLDMQTWSVCGRFLFQMLLTLA